MNASENVMYNNVVIPKTVYVNITNIISNIYVNITNIIPVFRKGVFPLYWVSDDGRRILVPPGPADYMHYRTFIDFAVHGAPADDWIEYDNGRVPFKHCCQYIINMNVSITQKQSFTLIRY